MLGQNRGLCDKIIHCHDLNFIFLMMCAKEPTIPSETQGRRNVTVLAGIRIICETWAAFCAPEQLERAEVFF